jgi:hypothetical protein
MSNLFIVTSVIQTGSQRWSYTPVRSVFSPEQRLAQTLQTIESIRTYCPDSRILLVEGGPLTDAQRTTLVSVVDFFVDAYAMDGRTRAFCLASQNKGLGDAWLLLMGLRYIKEESLTALLLFKMSGRYRLNNQFRLDRIVHDKPTFRRVTGAGCITFCFAVPGIMIDTFIRIMEHTVNEFQHRIVSIEDFLPPQFSSIHEITCIGAEGQIAVNRSCEVYSV